MNEETVNAETAGRFTLYRKLPAGGMGRVFEAEDPVGPRRVALKLIDLGTDPDSLQIVECGTAWGGVANAALRHR